MKFNPETGKPMATSYTLDEFTRRWPDVGFKFDPWTGKPRRPGDVLAEPDDWIKWPGSCACPVLPDARVDVRWRSGATEYHCKAAWIVWGPGVATYRLSDIGACSLNVNADSSVEALRVPPTAPDILTAAAKHMSDRAKTYDKPGGERSMGQTVEAFNAITGRDLQESEGWLLMQILKDVRDRQRAAPHVDSLEDGVAYAALKAEARMGGR